MSSVNWIIRLMLSLLIQPKVIQLSGGLCINVCLICSLVLSLSIIHNCKSRSVIRKNHWPLYQTSSEINGSLAFKKCETSSLIYNNFKWCFFACTFLPNKWRMTRSVDAKNVLRFWEPPKHLWSFLNLSSSFRVRSTYGSKSNRNQNKQSKTITV